MRWAIGIALLGAAGCHDGGRDDVARPAPPVASNAPWSTAAPGDSAAEAASAPTTGGDEGARAELLRAASARAATSASPSKPPGGDTHLPGSGDVDVAPPSPPKPTASAEPAAGGAGPDVIERSARAQLYWPLTQRCKDDAGAILPPESVEVMFDVDEDGYLVTSTISAIAKERRFEQAAVCMRRELARSSFRAPAAARGAATQIKLWVPSTD